jgi:hypothetical protein
LRDRSTAEIGVLIDEDFATRVEVRHSIESGAQEEMMFGRNGLALHYVHEAYEQALGLETRVSSIR